MIITGWNTRYSSEDTVMIRKGEYSDGSTALQVFSEYGEPLCTATICLAEYNEKPSEGNVFIKNYSENEGVLEALQRAGVVGQVVRTIQAKYVEFQEVSLLVDVT